MMGTAYIPNDLSRLSPSQREYAFGFTHLWSSRVTYLLEFPITISLNDLLCNGREILRVLYVVQYIREESCCADETNVCTSEETTSKVLVANDVTELPL